MSQKRRYTFDGHPVYLLGERETEYYGKVKIQDFYALREQCLRDTKLFEDDEFPATNESLFYARKDGQHAYKWLRPKEICKNPDFFVKGYSRFDVQQGELYDCWFLAAAASLTLNQKLFSRVVCDDNSFIENYAGIFHFCFWCYGKWVDVVIDDRLPTYNGKLVYNRSIDGNEFWSALLEKAYAKLHGNYESLVGGNTSEALEDFTGGISERHDIKEAQGDLFPLIQKAFERQSMVGCSIEPTSENLTTMQTPQGLIRGHAYSITAARYVDIVTPNLSGKIPMLRLRNPWGDEIEWNGPFSDKAKEWSVIPDYAKKEMELAFDNDGEFWMSHSDFLKYFDHLEICNLSPNSLNEDVNVNVNWKINNFEGEWIAGISSGGCNDLQRFHYNPQFIVKLENPDSDSDDGKCSIVISLMQKNTRKKRKFGCKLLTIGFKIFHLTEDELTQKPLKADFFLSHVSIERSTFINLRTVSSRLKLSPGHYLIVPATHESGEGEFLIRVFSHGQSSIEENDEMLGAGEVDLRIADNVPDFDFYGNPLEISEKIFSDVANSNVEIGWMELQKILNILYKGKKQKRTKSKKLKKVLWKFVCKSARRKSHENIKAISELEEFSKDICRSMVAMLDFDRSGKLGLDEFRVLIREISKWKNVFQLYDKDKNNKLDTYELRDALESAGYRLNNHILGSLLYRYGAPDNTMTVDDFIMCAIKVKTMVERFREKAVNGKNQATFTMDEWITSSTYS